MFVYCEKLEKIIANFNFKMIKEMAFMFCYCTKLSKVDLSHSDLSHVFDLKEKVYTLLQLMIIWQSEMPTGWDRYIVSLVSV